MNNNLNSFSIIMPVFNEEKIILTTLRNYFDYFKKLKSDFEIIVVVNNSIDNSFKLSSDYAKDKNEIIVLNFPFYTGKGGAVKEGFKKASKSLIGFVDSDNSTVPREFHKLIKQLNNFDGVIASRSLPESRIIIKQPFHRIFFGFGFRKLVQFIFGWNYRDTQCGAKIFKATAIKKVLPELKIKGWAFDVEILWKLKKYGFKVKEAPVEWNDSNESKFKLSAIPSMFVELLRIRFL